jgi:hypothetical protein
MIFAATEVARRLPLCGLVALAVALLLGCGGGGGSDDIPEGGQCQVCRSAEPRCNTGLSCQRFQSDFFYSLCARPGTTSCPVPF